MVPVAPRFDSLDPERGGRSFLFADPVDEVVARTIGEVLPAMERVERAVRSGLHAAGFVAYEAAPAFDPALVAGRPGGLPLLQFGLFATRRDIRPLEGLPEDGAYELGDVRPELDPRRYAEIIAALLELIAAGDAYQVNFTFPLRGRFRGDPLALYRDLCLAQRSAFCAYLEVGSRAIVSASPELFFRLNGRRAELRPMKGTRPRGRWSAEDEMLARELAESPKERAENLMIVDLLRNDLGRVAEFGSVRVPRLFEVERYPTVHQLTSTITGQLRPDTGIADLFRALFPSGSVTGAPKIRTSAIIHQYEDFARGVYTGAVGFVSPGEAVFSVAIRTAVVDQDAGTVEIGVGSGITADSAAAAEYRECLSKGEFLRRRMPRFELLESLRLENPGGYPFIDAHLERLRASAAYFNFPWQEEVVRDALLREAQNLPVGTYKVRLLLDRDGGIRIDSSRIPDRLPTARVSLSDQRVDSADPFLFHKTTYRPTYERALAACPDCDDVILLNEKGELAEATRANVVLDLDGELVTPALACGLLPGVFRGGLLGEGRISERVLYPSDLVQARRIYLINAVRGWREAVLVEGTSGLERER